MCKWPWVLLFKIIFTLLKFDIVFQRCASRCFMPAYHFNFPQVSICNVLDLPIQVIENYPQNILFLSACYCFDSYRIINVAQLGFLFLFVNIIHLILGFLYIIREIPYEISCEVHLI